MTLSAADPATLAASLASMTTPMHTGQWCARPLATRAGTLVDDLRLIAESTGGVLFHCAGGKDRTGVLAAAVLVCLSADREDIINDDALTRANLAAVNAQMSGMLGAQPNGASAILRTLPNHPLLEAQPETCVPCSPHSTNAAERCHF